MARIFVGKTNAKEVEANPTINQISSVDIADATAYILLYLFYPTLSCVSVTKYNLL